MSAVTRSEVARVVALAALYVATARVGLALDAIGGFATVVWAPTGISLAALLRGGRRLWPGVTLGAFIVNLWTGAPVAVAAGIATGNTLEALAGLACLRFAGFRPSLERLRDALVLVGLAGLVATTVSASIGVASLVAGGVIAADTAAAAWRAWWLGDVAGAVVITPLLLTWTTPVEPRLPRRRLEAASLVATTALVAAVVLFEAVGPAVEDTYLLLPLCAWAALRFSLRGTTATIFLIVALAIAATTADRGPFVRDQLAAGLIGLQAFMTVLAASGVALAAAIAERDRLARANHLLYQAACQAVTARDRFLSLASHELRTPITALVLQLDSAQKVVDAPVVDPARLGRLSGRLQSATRSTEHLAALVDRMFDVSRLSVSELALAPAPCDLAAVVREAAERLSETAGQAGCDLTVVGDDEVAGTWDAVRLHQVISNLIANAIRYAAGYPIRVSLVATRDTATVVVEDGGVGIAAADTDRIFELFERGAADGHDSGLGIGLYLVKAIVEAHGGRVAATATPGRGARFVVDLPRRTG